ncbi:MAG: DUF4345 family protein [Fimbriimonadaceae bacterium]|nr:DUF4345 family protein [Chitinophagales bacterium]
MAIQVYLWINAILYLLFALWCLWRPTATAAYNGLSFMNGAGKAEYHAVYVGMEAGFAIFFAYCALNESMQKAGILFAVCTYAGIVLMRIYSIARFGGATASSYIIGGLEVVLGIIASILLFRYFPN